MKPKNPAFENSLACLQHPVTLLSIAILLLNDHVLKVVSPSWLTGKLSDFAGLFFFPFIVAAGLSLLLSKFNLSRERIGQIAFGIVAIWFTLLKTIPLVNSLTAQLASLFIGAPAKLALDPTDLMALVVLWSAWMMWRNSPPKVVSNKAYLSLALGVVASLASMPPLPPYEVVVALAYQDGNLCAQGTAVKYEFLQIVQSKDKGETWKGGCDFTETMLSQRNLPVRACDPVNLQACYQIDGTDKVSTSNDGGKSWQIAWEVPPERREYVARVSGEITTYDLIIAQDGDSRYLFVARGRNGILRRQLPDGEWIQLGVEKAQPAPLFAADLSSAFTAARRELIIWLGFAFLSLLILQTAIWAKVVKERNITSLLKRLLHSSLVVFIFIMVDAIIAYGVFLFGFGFPGALMWIPDAAFIWIYRVAIGLAIIVPFAWLIGETDSWIAKEAPNDEARPKIIFYCSMTIIGVWLFGALLWPLWALGIIGRYQLALLISVSISVLITALGYKLIRNAK